MKLRAWKPFMTTGRIKNDITRLDYIELLSESINHLPQPHLYSPWWPSDWPSWPGHWRSSWMMTPGWVSPPDPDPPPRSLRPPASRPPASSSGLRCCCVCPASCNKGIRTWGLNINLLLNGNFHWIDMWKITWSVSPSSEDHCLSSILADLKQLVLLGDHTGAVPRASLVRDDSA